MAARITNTIWFRSLDFHAVATARSAVLTAGTWTRRTAVGADPKTGEYVALDLVAPCPDRLDAVIVSYPLEALYESMVGGDKQCDLEDVASGLLDSFGAFPDHWIMAELDRRGLPVSGAGLVDWTRRFCTRRESAMEAIRRRRRNKAIFGHEWAGDWMRANWGSGSVAFNTEIQVDSPACVVVRFATKTDAPKAWFERLRSSLVAQGVTCTSLAGAPNTIDIGLRHEVAP